MPATAVFYHLLRAGLDEMVMTTVTRAQGAGWRVMIRAPDAALLQHLDAKLWLGPEEGFLAHGLAGGVHDADQPVLLGQGHITNGAQGLMLLAGAEAARDEVAALQRIWVLFDGADPEAVAHRMGLGRAVLERRRRRMGQEIRPRRRPFRSLNIVPSRPKLR